MEKDTILFKAQKLQEEIMDSALYRRLKELSLAIENDPEIQALARKRDDCYRQANGLEEGEQKHLLLIEAKKLDDSIHAKDIVKQYDDSYLEMKEVLSHLEEGLRRILS